MVKVSEKRGSLCMLIEVLMLLWLISIDRNLVLRQDMICLHQLHSTLGPCIESGFDVHLSRVIIVFHFVTRHTLLINYFA